MRSIKLVIIAVVLPLLAGCPEGSGNGQPSPPPSPTPSAEAQRSAILEQELRDEREKLGRLTKALTSGIFEGFPDNLSSVLFDSVESRVAFVAIKVGNRRDFFKL